MKYILVSSSVGSYPIIFDNRLTHATVAGNFLVKSAGFIDEDWNCYGESYSLGLQSDPQDTSIIKTFLNKSSLK